MPRKEKPRSIGSHTEINMRNALQAILNGMSVRKTSKEFNIPFTTLRRYYTKSKSFSSIESMRVVPHYDVNKVFSNEQEKSLKEYVIYSSSLFYGLTSKGTRHLAYEMAKMNNLKMPKTWEDRQMAGKEWLRSFMRRHSDISLRKPEPCSLARATAFNKTNVEVFYNNLESLMKRFPELGPDRIFNLDETSTTTVQKPQRVIAPKGHRNVGKVTSGERGSLVTTCCIISAGGTALPPVMVFPRKNFKNFMTKNTPPGTLGLAASSGWMNSEIFPEVIKHLIKYSNSSLENPCILIMDNHGSHLSIEALNLAKASGVHVLTLHPHTSAKLQPLDVGVYGPFKTYYNAAMDSWLMQHPGRPISIYDIGEIVGTAFLKAMTPVNIINSFKKCGIYPFDRNIFTDDDFMPSTVTDRPYDSSNEDMAPIPGPSCCTSVGQRVTRKDSEETVELTSREVSPSIMDFSAKDNLEQGLGPQSDKIHNSQVLLTELSNTNVILSRPLTEQYDFSQTENVDFISPFQFRDPIKAGPRKSNRKPRKLGRSIIATDTPEKNEIEMAKKKKDPKQKKVVKKVLQSESDEEDQDINVEYQESDEDNEWPDDGLENEAFLTENDLKKPLPRPPGEGEFVLVEFATKKQKVYYIGKVLESRNENLEYYISYLRKKTLNKYAMPIIPELFSVKEHDIKLILPKPTFGGSTIRQQSYYCFPIDFSQLNMR